jgi:hypothetical protein
MMDPKVLEKHVDGKSPYIGVAVVVKLKGYDLFFRREPADLVADPDFTPFFWRRKGDDQDDEDLGKEKENDGTKEPGQNGSHVVNTEVDASQTPSATSSGKSVSGTTQGASGFFVAVTPFNPNPQSPRGKGIFARAQSISPGLVASSPTACIAPPSFSLEAIAYTISVLVEESSAVTVGGQNLDLATSGASGSVAPDAYGPAAPRAGGSAAPRDGSPAAPGEGSQAELVATSMSCSSRDGEGCFIDNALPVSCGDAAFFGQGRADSGPHASVFAKGCPSSLDSCVFITLCNTGGSDYTSIASP